MGVQDSDHISELWGVTTAMLATKWDFSRFVFFFIGQKIHVSKIHDSKFSSHYCSWMFAKLKLWIKIYEFRARSKNHKTNRKNWGGTIVHYLWDTWVEHGNRSALEKASSRVGTQSTSADQSTAHPVPPIGIPGTTWDGASGPRGSTGVGIRHQSVRNAADWALGISGF